MSKLRVLVLAAAVSLLASSHTGRAQDTSVVDDLNRVVEDQDLDSYWAQQRTWLEYGYRPHVKVLRQRFEPSLPSYFAGRNAYSFGTTLPPESTVDPLEKSNVQMTKYGTWH